MRTPKGDSITEELGNIQKNMISSYMEKITSMYTGETPDERLRALVVAITPDASERTKFIYPSWTSSLERAHAMEKIDEILKDVEALGAVLIQHILVEAKDEGPEIPGLAFSSISPGHKSTIFLTYESDGEEPDFNVYPVEFDDAVKGLTVFHRS